MVDERFADDFGPTGSFRLDRMVNAYRTVLEKLEPLHVEVIRPAYPGVPSIFGDTPVVHYDQVRASLRGGLPLGEADHIYMPLAPGLAVVFTAEFETGKLMEPWRVQRTNHLVMACVMGLRRRHPQTDFGRAIP